MAEDKSVSLVILGVVAIVALIGLVMLFSGGVTGKVAAITGLAEGGEAQRDPNVETFAAEVSPQMEALRAQLLAQGIDPSAADAQVMETFMGQFEATFGYTPDVGGYTGEAGHEGSFFEHFTGGDDTGGGYEVGSTGVDPNTGVTWTYQGDGTWTSSSGEIATAGGSYEAGSAVTDPNTGETWTYQGDGTWTSSSGESHSESAFSSGGDSSSSWSSASSSGGDSSYSYSPGSSVADSAGNTWTMQSDGSWTSSGGESYSASSSSH